MQTCYQNCGTADFYKKTVKEFQGGEVGVSLCSVEEYYKSHCLHQVEETAQKVWERYGGD